MTISGQNNRNDYTGNGATATYSYGFKILSKTDLKVVKRDTSDVETVLTVDTDYTVSGVGASAGGSITLTAGNLPTNYKLTIRRLRPLTQGTDIRNQGAFYPEVHEDAFDDLTMKDQTQQVELDRTIKLPETVTGVSVNLPVPSALKVLRWNSGATALEQVAPADISTLVTAVDASLTLTGQNLSVAKPVRETIAGGTVDAITATFSPALSALANNIMVLVEAAGANTSTTPTFAPDGLAAKTIVKGNNLPLLAGDIPGADAKMSLIFDSTLDKWVLLNPYFSRSDVQSGTLVYASTSGTNTYTAPLSPAITAYTVGMVVHLLVPLANTITTPTLNLNGLGAKTIRRITPSGTAALNVGDIIAGHYGVFWYDGTYMVLLNPAYPGAGQTVQVVHTQTGAVATANVVIPWDDTIPQNTEGVELMTRAITPTATTNKLLIEAVVHLSAGAGENMTVALFQDTTAGALAAAAETCSLVNGTVNIKLRHEMVAGTISATTFKIRGGPHSAASATFNGYAAGRIHGGVYSSSIRVTEIQV